LHLRRRPEPSKEISMSDNTSSRVDAGKGPPPTGGEQTTERNPFDGRQVPGGSIEAAQRPIGMNAINRDQLPTRGVSLEEQYRLDQPMADVQQRPPSNE
jgi:hypothetical protein